MTMKQSRPRTSPARARTFCLVTALSGLTVSTVGNEGGTAGLRESRPLGRDFFLFVWGPQLCGSGLGRIPLGR